MSRRTFFNYYASKENAVLGIPVRSDTSDLEDAFVTGTGSLVDDFAELHIARWERLDLTRPRPRSWVASSTASLASSRTSSASKAEGERDDIALVRRRADAPADLRPRRVVQVFGALLRPAVFEYFADDSQDFRALLLRRLDAARSIFSL